MRRAAEPCPWGVKQNPWSGGIQAAVAKRCPPKGEAAGLPGSQVICLGRSGVTHTASPGMPTAVTRMRGAPASSGAQSVPFNSEKFFCRLEKRSSLKLKLQTEGSCEGIFYSNRAKFRNPLSKQHGSYSKPSSKAICCYRLPAALQTCRGGEYLQFFTSPGAWCLHVQLPGFVAGPHPSFILAHVQPLSRTAGAKGSRWKLPTPATSQ